MRMLNVDRSESLWQLQLYLTPKEALELRAALDQLLKDPEANEHETLIHDGRELSFSLVTPRKLANLSGYSPEEQRMFKER